MSTNDIVVAIDQAKAPPWSEALKLMPEGWRLDDDGVSKLIKNKDDSFEYQPVSGPIWVPGFTRDHAGGGWGAVIKWMDRDKTLHERAVPAGRFHEQGPTLAQELASEGLRIIPGAERKLLTYLGAYDHDRRVRSVAHLGWMDNTDGKLAYVLPKEIINKGDAEAVVFQPERYAPTTGTIKSSGTLEQWQQHIAQPCRNNPLLVFGICTGLTGPLAKPAGMDGGGFHFYGTTSRGKTTQLQLAASTLGCGADPSHAGDLSMIRRWNTTGNGSEGLAAAHNDGPLLLDEIGMCAAKDFGALIYTIAGGQGKVAMNADRNLKPVRSWRVLILSTGEISSREKIEQGGRSAKGGQLLRLIDIPAPEKGSVDDTHGLDSDKFIDQLKRDCGVYYGTAMPAFIKALVKDAESANELRQKVQSLVDNYTDELNIENSYPEQRRAIQRFALVAVAGAMASKLEILPFDKNEIMNAVKYVLNLWLSDQQGEATDAERGIAAVREFILKHEARFRPVDDADVIVRDLSGYVDRARNLYLFTKDGFSEACSGNNSKTILHELEKRGLLFVNEKGRLISKHQISGYSNRIGLYAVKGGIVESDVDEKK